MNHQQSEAVTTGNMMSSSRWCSILVWIVIGLASFGFGFMLCSLKEISVYYNSIALVQQEQEILSTRRAGVRDNNSSNNSNMMAATDGGNVSHSVLGQDYDQLIHQQEVDQDAASGSVREEWLEMKRIQKIFHLQQNEERDDQKVQEELKDKTTTSGKKKTEDR